MAASSAMTPYLPWVSGVRGGSEVMEGLEGMPGAEGGLASGGEPRAEPQAALSRSKGLGLAALQLLGLATVCLFLLCSFFSQSSQNGRE